MPGWPHPGRSRDERRRPAPPEYRGEERRKPAGGEPPTTAPDVARERERDETQDNNPVG